MKQIERASVFRLFADFVKADGIIDAREVECLDEISDKYSIKKEDKKLASRITLADAFAHIEQLTKPEQTQLMEDVVSITMSDKHCARAEALLLLAFQMCFLKQDELCAHVISIHTEGYFEPAQILYVESEFDSDMNWEINENFRAISAEIRLTGFDFIYLPKLAEHYRSISQELLSQIVQFLYPSVGIDGVSSLVNQMRKLSTSDFCKDQLAGKLGAKEFLAIPPSLLIKIGESYMDGKLITDFLLLELESPVLTTVRNIVDAFSKFYHTMRLNPTCEDDGRFVYVGFNKQIFDLYTLRKGIKSKVVIDVFRSQIRLPEADVQLRLHRREKALYALFLLESASGGINFRKPDSHGKLTKYINRMKSVQEKYNIIYQKFGGEYGKAPDLENERNRLPMIALIRRELMGLSHILACAEDYAVQRNIYGNYAVNISSSLCCCCGVNMEEICKLADSDEWQRISAI